MTTPVACPDCAAPMVAIEMVGAALTTDENDRLGIERAESRTITLRCTGDKSHEMDCWTAPSDEPVHVQSIHDHLVTAAMEQLEEDGE